MSSLGAYVRATSALLATTAGTVAGIASSLIDAPRAGASSLQYDTISDLRAKKHQVGCADVAWAATQGLLDPVEVRWLATSGVNCPDGSVAREGVPSEQYVVMVARAARGELDCADVDWNAVHGYLTWSAFINVAGMVGCPISRYGRMVSLQASGRLTCPDVHWNYFNGQISKEESYWLALAERCDWSAIDIPVTRTITYQVGVSGNPGADVEEFRQQAHATLNDPRGWRRGGLEFVEVRDGAEFTPWLADASSMPSQFGCSGAWSCRTGRNVVINDLRWRETSPAWVTSGGSLRDYRHMVVNHETGHWLGWDHSNCGGAEQPAPVMQQQSIDLQGCVFNAWPLDWELAV